MEYEETETGRVNDTRVNDTPANGETRDLQDKPLRVLADAENARKRADLAWSEDRVAGIAEIVPCFIPALDNSTPQSQSCPVAGLAQR